jgi:hypothetical protein
MTDQQPSADQQPPADKVKAAVQTYLYGYPLVYNLTEVAGLVAGRSALGAPAPLNTFGAARNLLGPDAKFVTPNNDTLYLIAACDLSGGPLVLDVPDTDDRYYGLQFVDAWTNNFAYIGRRATGTAAGSFLLAPDGFDGDSGGHPVVPCPSTVFTIVGRIQVNGADDLPAVHALQDAFHLSPAPGASGAPAGLPQVDRVPGELSWWESFRTMLQAFPPPAADADYVEAARSLGLVGTDRVLVDPDPALAAVLVEAERQGAELFETLSKTSLAIVDGWSTALHAFDYNLDHLGPGTIDAPEWKIADRTTAYVTRAVAARLGLWGNHGYEADYHILWQDEHGEFLDGSRRYELTLSPPPPVGAFWSLTMYDEPDYYLVDNPIDRYSIGDRTPGVQVADDGSVTILMQHESPGPDRESNWLPAPEGAFRPVLRSYQPGPALLDGSYRFPKVRRVD